MESSIKGYIGFRVLEFGVFGFGVCDVYGFGVLGM